MGNLIQMGMLAVSIAVGFAFVQAEGEQNTARLSDIEARLRVVEADSQRRGAEMTAIASAMNDIKQQQRENNQLLRQLLSRIGGTVQ